MPEPVAPAGMGTPVQKTFYVRATRNRVRLPDLRMAAEVLVDGAALLPGLGGYNTDQTDDEPATTLTLTTLAGYGGLQGLRRTVQVTGWWGWYPIPGGIVDAGYRLAARLFHEQRAAYSDAVISGDGMLQYFKQLPASVQAAVQRYQIAMIGSANVGSTQAVLGQPAFGLGWRR